MPRIGMTAHGFEGQYYNLSLIHEDVEPEGEVYPQENVNV